MSEDQKYKALNEEALDSLAQRLEDDGRAMMYLADYLRRPIEKINLSELAGLCRRAGLALGLTIKAREESDELTPPDPE